MTPTIKSRVIAKRSSFNPLHIHWYWPVEKVLDTNDMIVGEIWHCRCGKTKVRPPLHMDRAPR